jgi:Uri superfamily endonuclease
MVNTPPPVLLSIPLEGVSDTPAGSERLPRQKGTYVLLMRLMKPHQLTVGRLGKHRFSRGWYTYVGSAFGPGGLRARIRHHLRHSAIPRWHIDYLTRHITPNEAWVTVHRNHWEHRLAQWLQRLSGSEIAVHGFGSSDCHCLSHLFRFNDRPALRTKAETGADVSTGLVGDPAQIAGKPHILK